MTHGVFECANEHIAILYGSEPCPLCASHETIENLKGLLRHIDKELGGEFSPSMNRKIQHALKDL